MLAGPTVNLSPEHSASSRRLNAARDSRELALAIARHARKKIDHLACAVLIRTGESARTMRLSYLRESGDHCLFGLVDAMSMSRLVGSWTFCDSLVRRTSLSDHFAACRPIAQPLDHSFQLGSWVSGGRPDWHAEIWLGRETIDFTPADRKELRWIEKQTEWALCRLSDQVLPAIGSETLPCPADRTLAEDGADRMEHYEENIRRQRPTRG